MPETAESIITQGYTPGDATGILTQGLDSAGGGGLPPGTVYLFGSQVWQAGISGINFATMTSAGNNFQDGAIGDTLTGELVNVNIPGTLTASAVILGGVDLGLLYNVYGAEYTDNGFSQSMNTFLSRNDTFQGAIYVSSDPTSLGTLAYTGTLFTNTGTGTHTFSENAVQAVFASPILGRYIWMVVTCTTTTVSTFNSIAQSYLSDFRPFGAAATAPGRPGPPTIKTSGQLNVGVSSVYVLINE